MQVERPEPGRLQHVRRQDLAIGDHHRRIEPKGAEGGDLVRIAHGPGRADGQAQLLGEGLHRRWPHLLAPPTRRRRLGVHGRDLVAGGDELGEGFHGELGRAEEGQAHGGGLAATSGARQRRCSSRPSR